MQTSRRLLSTFITFAAVGIKFIFPLFLAYFGSDKDFSFLLITYNTILISGHVFSLEHNKIYHRRAVHNNQIQKIDLLERIYFDRTLIFKLLILIITLMLLDKFSIIQKIFIFLIVYLDLHLVESCRKEEVLGNYLRNNFINSVRITLPIILFITFSFLFKTLSLNLLFFSILTAFILVIYFFKIRLCNFLNLRLKTKLFFKITVRSFQYAILTILSLFNPLLDKFVLLNFEEYSLIQSISLWAIFGNLISLFILEYINKPYKPKIINFLSKKDFNKISLSIIFYQVLLMFIVIFIVFLFRSPLETIMNPSFEFNYIQIICCCFISASIPINAMFYATLYGYKKDNQVLYLTIFEFLLKYIFCIFTLIFLKGYYLPYTLSLNVILILLFKYWYSRNYIFHNFEKIIK